MAAVVVDASETLAWLIRSQTVASAEEVLTEVRHGAAAVVPWRWFQETANGLLVAVRRRLIDEAEYRRSLTWLVEFEVQADDTPGQTAFRRTSHLAEAHGLTVYDATYLELALRRGIRLASRDAALRSAARRAGVIVVG
jgi:predicted nucleic acid-binding protein